MATKQIAHTSYAITVLVAGEGPDAKAFLSRVIVCATPLVSRAGRRKGRGKLVRVTGSVSLAPSTRKQLNDVVAPMINRVLEEAGIAPHQFRISVANVDSASRHDLRTHVEGFSADLSFAVAMLFAALGIPGREDAVLTGHISSPEGHVGMVSQLEDKFVAGQADPSRKLFLYPDLGPSRDAGAVPPEEFDRCRQVLCRIDRRLQAVPIQDLAQALPFLVNDYDLALASLACGYYGQGPSALGDNSPVAGAIRFFLTDNEGRFLSSLGNELRPADNDRAQAILDAYAHYHIDRSRYPSGFGATLDQLLLGLPPSVLRHEIRFPMLAHKTVFALGLLAGPDDQEDAILLSEVCLGRRLAQRPASHTDLAPQSGTAQDEIVQDAVQHVLEELSEESFYRRVGVRIDQARNTFVPRDVRSSSHLEFQDTCTAFYRHLLTHSRVLPIPADDCMVAAGGVTLLDDAFADQGGHHAAEAEARRPQHGGIGLVINHMTEQFKRKLFLEHRNYVLKEALDPLDAAQKLEFMRALMARLGGQLPPDVRSRSPEDFVERQEEIIQTCASFLDKLADAFRRV